MHFVHVAQIMIPSSVRRATMIKFPVRSAIHYHHRRHRLTFSSTALPLYKYEELQNSLPKTQFTTNPYELEWHGKGQSYHPSVPPDVVATPGSMDDLRSIVQFCVKERVPIIPFGTGTSLEGHVAALNGGISVDMSQFQSIEIPEVSGSDDLPDPIAQVGAGVTRLTLNEALRHTGMQFMVDPGADASIGGMVSTGASGTAAVKYGTMRENILALECVLPDEDATIVRAGTRALKNSAGYDLLSLMCGSEGTLGIITSVTVKLHVVPEHVIAATCAFRDLFQAAQAVAALKLHNIAVSRCELLDAASVLAFNDYNSSSNQDALPVMPTLFLEFQGPTQRAVEEQVALSQDVCTGEYGGLGFSFASDEEQRLSLWKARHSLYYAAIASRPGAESAIVTDACVPLSRFAELIHKTNEDVREMGVVGPCFGHAGDGNMHCILPVLQNDDENYVSKLWDINDRLIRRTLEMGGTCSGEHGVGYGKIKYLKRQYGNGAVEMMKRIKRGLDPHNIMNPGKIVKLD